VSRVHRHLARAAGLFVVVAVQAVACLVTIREPPDESSASASGSASGSGAGSADGAMASATASSSGSGGQAGASSAYAAAVLADKPLAYYRMNDIGVRKLLDWTGNGHDGSYKGSAGALTLEVGGALVGDPDKAVLFEGGYAELDADGLDFPDKAHMTLEAWILPDLDGGVAVGGGIGGKSVYDGGYDGYLWLVHQGGIRLHRTAQLTLDPSQSDTDQTDTPLPAGFIHVVTTFDGLEVRHYFNAELQPCTCDTKVPMPDIDEPFRIGIVKTWGAFHGVVDEVAIYGEVLEKARIDAHFAIGTGK